MRSSRGGQPYAATKAAIVNFTKNLSQQVLERDGTQAPIGRAGQPVEVAPAYVYCASQESSYVSGEVIGVTGVTGGTPLH